MLSRTVHAKQVKVINLGLSSTFQIGDTEYVDSSSIVIALKNEDDFIDDDPEKFKDFPVFLDRLPLPVIHENVSILKIDKKPEIHVDFINILALSSASLLVLGNVSHSRLSSRILNIRHLSTLEAEEFKQSMEGG